MAHYIYELRTTYAPKMTRQRLADLLGVSSTTIYRWEKLGVEPERKNIEQLAEIFNVAVHSFYGSKQPETPSTFAITELSRVIAEQQEQIHLLEEALNKARAQGKPERIYLGEKGPGGDGNKDLEKSILEYLKMMKDAKTIDILFSDIKPYLLQDMDIFFKSYPHYLDLLGLGHKYDEQLIRHRLKEHFALHQEIEEYSQQSSKEGALPVILKVFQGGQSV